jgi:AdoMet-dependent rRNA methyltransferase SPB1
MQLQMTAPLDIGLEQQDAALGLGQDDIFDLGGTENGLRKRGGILRLIDEDGDVAIESGDEGVSDGDESSGFLDSEEERGRKMKGLEDELDGLYDAYQERLRERDAKFKVMEARRNNAEREEWHGISKQSDKENDSEVEGGWDNMERSKKFDEDLSSDGDSSDDDDEFDIDRPNITGQKRPHTEGRETSTSQKSKRARLITRLEEPQSAATTSKAAQVWFSQGVFADVDGIDDVGDEGEEVVVDDMDVDEDEQEAEWEDAVGNELSTVF